MHKEYKNKIITQLFKLRNKNCTIAPNVIITKTLIGDNAIIDDYTRLSGNPKIQIGSDFYCNAFCHFYGNIIIGNDVQIGPKTVIWTRNHKFSKNSKIKDQGHESKQVVIKDDVWIGANCTILGGVTLGKGSIIGAGSVVTKDTEEYSINVGNPAKVIKYRE